MSTDFTPDRSRAKRRPRFGYQATVEVWKHTGPDARPIARLAVSGWAWHKEQAYRDIRHDAKCALHNLGLALEQVGEYHLEPNVDAWWALDPKHVRNPDDAWVPASGLVLNAEDLAQGRRTRTLVPQDHDESGAWYGAEA